MAIAPRLREFDPKASYRQLATNEESPRPGAETALYRFYDTSKRLLYVGVTGQPRERWVKHRRSAPWWSLATFVAVDLHPTPHEALQAERAAIQSEAPQFNKRSRKGGR